jgi:hypothetical protein
MWLLRLRTSFIPFDEVHHYLPCVDAHVPIPPACFACQTSVWAIENSQVSPFLIDLGLSRSWVSLALMAGKHLASRNALPLSQGPLLIPLGSLSVSIRSTVG